MDTSYYWKQQLVSSASGVWWWHSSQPAVREPAYWAQHAPNLLILQPIFAEPFSERWTQVSHRFGQRAFFSPHPLRAPGDGYVTNPALSIALTVAEPEEFPHGPASSVLVAGLPTLLQPDEPKWQGSLQIMGATNFLSFIIVDRPAFPLHLPPNSLSRYYPGDFETTAIVEFNHGINENKKRLIQNPGLSAGCLGGSIACSIKRLGLFQHDTPCLSLGDSSLGQRILARRRNKSTQIAVYLRNLSHSTTSLSCQYRNLSVPLTIKVGFV